MSQVSSTRKLVSASAVMASGTMISRILGVVRVAMLAFILGASTRQVDMFELANSVPNSIYILFAGGALNTVLVPQIVRAIRNDEDAGEAYTNRIMTAFMLIVTVVTVAVTAAAPLVIGIYSSDAWRAENLTEQYASMVALAYLTLPQIFFYGAFFLLGQILNARDKFGPMMWAPIANNVVSVLVLGIYFVIWGNQQDHSAAFSTGQIWLLGLGSTIGIAVQMAVLLPYVRKVGFKLRPRFDLLGTGLGKTFRLAVWTIGFVAVNQVALVVVQRLATSATATGEGAGLYTYNQAHLLWILPHSLITVSLATAMLPNASRLAAAGDSAGVAAEFTKTLRLALIVIVPATLVFFSLAGPITGLLFGHGAASSDAHLIAWALMAFSVGLIPFTIQFVCLRTYYALEDTKTPFFLQLVIAGLNIVGAIALVNFVGDPNWISACLALSYSIAYLIGVFVSWRVLRRRIPQLNGVALTLHLVRLLIGSVAGGVGAYYLSILLVNAIGPGLVANLSACAAGGLVILGVYLLVGKLLKVRELANLSDLVRTRLGRKPTQTQSSEAEAAGARVAESLGDDGPPTIEVPLITDLPPDNQIDLDDSGPVTVVRNRAPVSAHDFSDDPSLAAPLPNDPLPIEASADADDTTSKVLDGEHDWEGEATGALNFDDIFRPAKPQIASVGTLLNTRYGLLELLAERHGTQTWRAHDSVLSRDVIVHVIAPGDPRISQLLLSARKGAVATDSRFLRVLDADELLEPTQGIGAYVVTEYGPGRSLTQLLEDGPLSAIEAAYIVRELADALAGVHSQGLFHDELNPDNVIITTSGAVRLVGFGVEATLVGRSEGAAWSTRERSDVTGLGSILYACLVHLWPGGPGYGLSAAPVVAGETAAARTVQAGISPALDRICTTTLTERGSAGERRISTAAQLADALGEVLGTAEASADLEQRVRGQVTGGPRQGPATMPIPVPAPATPSRAQPDPTHAAIPLASPDESPAPRRALWIIVILAIVALVVSLIVVATNMGRDTASGPQSPTSSVSVDGTGQPGSESPNASGPITIVAAQDFDPEADGGSNDENPDQVSAVFDGNPETYWQTMRYLNRPDLGGQKPGVGVVLDLGESRLVTTAHLNLGQGATSVELLVPNSATPSMQTVKNWSVVGASAEVTGEVNVELNTPTETRYVLVYLTKLPPVDGGFRGAIYDVSFS